MPKVYLLTGSNEGPSDEWLTKAAQLIQVHIGHVELFSSRYKTAPWGNTNQQHFLNQVLVVETTLSPLQVLNTILHIETSMGRIRHYKWAPRIIDIDILFYDTLVVKEPDLQIPHPLLHERRFTLAPLAEVAPTFLHPTLNKNMLELLAQCEDVSTVEKL